MKRFARRIWDALHKFVEERLADITKDFWWDWPRFLRWSGLVALPLAATLHVVQAITLGRGGSLGVAVVVGVSVVAAALLVLQGWALWQTHLDATKRRPYVVAVLLFAVTVSVCIEAFAGVTLWLASRGWVIAHEAAPSLWTAERVYLWHLIDSVPVLSITRTLGWAEPAVFSGGAGGALILLFKILLILPLVQLAIAGYELIHAASEAAIERADDRQRRGQRSFGFGNGEDLWILALSLFVATAVISGCVLFVFDPASWMNRWLAAHLAPGFSLARVHVPTAWLQTAPQWIGTVALIYFTALTAEFLAWETDSSFRSLSQVVSGVLSYLGILCLLTLIGITVSLTLLHVGLVRVQSAIPPHAQVWSALDAYARSVAEAIPGLDVPERLDWTPSYPFTGIVSGVLLLLYKIAFFAVLLVPITRIVRSFVHHLRPRAIVPAVTASGEFITLLRTMQTKLDEVERRTLANRDRKALRAKKQRSAAAEIVRLTAQTGAVQLAGDHRPKPYLPTSDASIRLRDFDFSLFGDSRLATHFDIDDLIAQIEAAFARVTTLFGEGEIRTCADGALTAVIRSQARLRDLEWDRSSFRGESVADALSKARSDLKEKTETFSTLAAKALAKQRLATKAHG